MYCARMAKRTGQALLSEAIIRFEDEVRAFALAAVRLIIVQEIEQRLEELRSGIAQVRHAPRVAKTEKPKPPAKEPEHARSKQVVEVAPSIETTLANPIKRGWTRDTIVSELATWLVSGTSVDASFITRHGPRGLVAAAKKTFGRFDAALNVASLQVSKMYPDGPPGRRAPLAQKFERRDLS